MYAPDGCAELRDQLVKAIQDTFSRFYLKATVVQTKLKALKQEFELIKLGEVPLTDVELVQAAEQCLADNLSDCRYHAIHIVDSMENLLTWSEENANFEQIISYVNHQREVLDSGGVVSRLFLFKRSFLADHLDVCARTVEHHDRLFEGTKKPVETLCSLVPGKLTFGSNDFSIINNTGVFLWMRSTKQETALLSGGRFFFELDRVKIFVDEWRRLASNAQPPERFLPAFARQLAGRK
jgi:hypothetical protein